MEKKTAAKGVAAAIAVKKIVKGVFVAGAVAAVVKVLRGGRTTT